MPRWSSTLRVGGPEAGRPYRLSVSIRRGHAMALDDYPVGPRHRLGDSSAREQPTCSVAPPHEYAIAWGDKPRRNGARFPFLDEEAVSPIGGGRRSLAGMSACHVLLAHAGNQPIDDKDVDEDHREGPKGEVGQPRQLEEEVDSSEEDTRHP